MRVHVGKCLQKTTNNGIITFFITVTIAIGLHFVLGGGEGGIPLVTFHLSPSPNFHTWHLTPIARPDTDTLAIL